MMRALPSLALGGVVVIAAACTSLLDIDGFHYVDGVGGSLTGTGTGTLGCTDTLPPDDSDCPAICNGGCSQGVCSFDCVFGNCNVVDCPADMDCTVLCHNNDSCAGATINCPDDHVCTIECRGWDGCRSAEVNCNGAVCQMSCGQGGDVCDFADLNCGPKPCTATCEGLSDPSVHCVESECACDPCGGN